MPLNRRVPKRGFYHETRRPFTIINLDEIETSFQAGAEVSLNALAERGLARPRSGGLKILGRGEITIAITAMVQAISAGARAKIEAAGGKVEMLGVETLGGEE